MPVAGGLTLDGGTRPGAGTRFAVCTVGTVARRQKGDGGGRTGGRLGWWVGGAEAATTGAGKGEACGGSAHARTTKTTAECTCTRRGGGGAMGWGRRRRPVGHAKGPGRKSRDEKKAGKQPRLGRPRTGRGGDGDNRSRHHLGLTAGVREAVLRRKAGRRPCPPSIPLSTPPKQPSRMGMSGGGGKKKRRARRRTPPLPPRWPCSLAKGRRVARDCQPQTTWRANPGAPVFPRAP